jgi:hypothetical protein
MSTTSTPSTTTTFYIYKQCDVTLPRSGFTVRLIDLGHLAVKDGMVTKLFDDNLLDHDVLMAEEQDQDDGFEVFMMTPQHGNQSWSVQQLTSNHALMDMSVDVIGKPIAFDRSIVTPTKLHIRYNCISKAKGTSIVAVTLSLGLNWDGVTFSWLKTCGYCVIYLPARLNLPMHSSLLCLR